MTVAGALLGAKLATLGHSLAAVRRESRLKVAFVGSGVLLLWAAVRMHARRALIGGALGAAIVLLGGGQALAVVTGLASGETEPVGLPWALVLGALMLYDAAVVAMGIGGVLLLRGTSGRQLPEGSAS